MSIQIWRENQTTRTSGCILTEHSITPKDLLTAEALLHSLLYIHVFS